jgi:hypothetical protein
MIAEAIGSPRMLGCVKQIGRVAIAVGALAAAAIGVVAPVQAAPSGPGNAQDTIRALQAQGFNVVVNKLGTAPLNQSSVIAVRPGQTFIRTDSGVPGAGNDIMTTVTGKTVYVDVA